MRILLFLATNLAIIVLASITFRLLGFESILAANGVDLDLGALLVFCALFGFGGAFVSLALSKRLAKWSTKAQIIERPSNPTERWLLDTVAAQASKAGIGMPEVAIFPAQEPNAFATGANRNKALVAVSAGLLNGMNRDEVEAVLGHEIGHVANGDMVTLTLIQGVVNTFVMFLARVIGFFVDRVVLRNERGLGIGYWITTIVAEIVLAILASAIVMWFSRRREFRADEAGARLAGRSKMIAALERLKRGQEMPNTMPDTMVAFGISSGARRGLRAMLASHPPLDARINALKAAPIP
ncbi:MAG: protease HtpX [Gammaproteobacteria bacterium]|nr:protease HtpX [Gammaproteobacteria bacterium]